MTKCNCKWKTVDPKRHEPQCDVVLVVNLARKERALADHLQLVPFPGMETFYESKTKDLEREISNLTRRLTRKDTPTRRKK